MGLVHCGIWICDMDLLLPYLQLWWICPTNPVWILIPFRLFPPVPVVSLPMNDATGNVLKGSLSGNTTGGAVLVPGQFGNGIYLGNDDSLVEFGFHHSNCFYDPDMCSQGVTFAMWIKRVPGAQNGYIFNTGGNYRTSKGNTIPGTRHLQWIIPGISSQTHAHV